MTTEQHKIIHIATVVGIVVIVIISVVALSSWREQLQASAVAETQAAQAKQQAADALQQANQARIDKEQALGLAQQFRAAYEAQVKVNEQLAATTAAVKAQGEAKVAQVTTLPITDIMADLTRIAGPATGVKLPPIEATDSQVRNVELALKKGEACSADLEANQSELKGCKAAIAKGESDRAQLQKAMDATATELVATQDALKHTQEEAIAWKRGGKTFGQRFSHGLKLLLFTSMGGAIGGAACWSSGQAQAAGCAGVGAAIGYAAGSL